MVELKSITKTIVHINHKILVFCSCLLIGCASQTKIMDVVGKYEGNHLMLYKTLDLRLDSTYTYTIEGDMYVYPIKQEGFWTLKNKSVKLSADENYKNLTVSYADSIAKYNLLFRFFNIEGEPVNDFTGNLLCDNENRYIINKLRDNIYIVELREGCENIIVENTNNLYENFSLNLKNVKVNIFNVHLFVKNEIQKDQWRFKIKDEILQYKKGFVYKKISN
jgi:hypothetical protein